MDSLSLFERLTLLPKFDAEKRTALHVQGQRAHAKHYASEGRAYMSSWRDEWQTDGIRSKEEESKNNKPVGIDLGTPVLKPRVKNLAKSAIPVGSSKANERKKTKKASKTVVTVESSDSNNEKRVLSKNERCDIAERKVNKSKEIPLRSKKKRVNDSSSNSSRVERE